MTPSTTADELDQNAVPHQLHHAPPVGRDCRIDHVAAMLLHGTKSPRLVRFHEAAIPDHIGHKDGCKPAMEALLGHVGLRWMPSDAVNCATEIQQQTAEGNAGLAPDRRIELRIGIKLGDVIVEGEDIYGDGVNVAVRLQGLAQPGGAYRARCTMLPATCWRCVAKFSVSSI
jgi:class 3 adenylate cyclase